MVARPRPTCCVAAFEIFRRRLRDGDAGGGHRGPHPLHAAPADRRSSSSAPRRPSARLRVPAPAATRHDSETEPISIGLWVGEATTPNRYARRARRFDELRDAGETDDRVPARALSRGAAPRSCRGAHATTTPLTGSPRPTTLRVLLPVEQCAFHERLPVQVDRRRAVRRPADLPARHGRQVRAAGVGTRSGVLLRRGRSSTAVADHPGRAAPALRPARHHRRSLRGGDRAALRGDGAAAEDHRLHGDDPARRRSQRAVRSRPSTSSRPRASTPTTPTSRKRRRPTSPGRLYVGSWRRATPPTPPCPHRRRAAPGTVRPRAERRCAKDAYWTLVAYHNSLRELGRTVTIARDDIMPGSAA